MFCSSCRAEIFHFEADVNTVMLDILTVLTRFFSSATHRDQIRTQNHFIDIFASCG